MFQTQFIAALRSQWNMRHDPQCFRAFARTYWRALLFFVVISAVISIGWGAWLMVNMPDGERGVSGGSSGAETLSREQLKKTVEAFENRDLNFKRLQGAASSVVDPSR